MASDSSQNTPTSKVKRNGKYTALQTHINSHTKEVINNNAALHNQQTPTERDEMYSVQRVLTNPFKLALALLLALMFVAQVVPTMDAAPAEAAQEEGHAKSNEIAADYCGHSDTPVTKNRRIRFDYHFDRGGRHVHVNISEGRVLGFIWWWIDDHTPTNCGSHGRHSGKFGGH